MHEARFSILRFCLTVFMMGFLAACSSGEKLPAIPSGSTVLILGDSLSYGTGASKGQDYPTLLAKSTGWHIINAGIPGNTSAQGLVRLPALLDEHQPKLLMIALGGNDFLRKVAIEQTEANLRAMIDAAKLKGIPTLLIAIPDYQPVKAAFGGLSDHQLYAKLAVDTQIPLSTDIFSPVLSKNSLKADYVHPNAAGYQAIEEALRASLASLGLLDEQS